MKTLRRLFTLVLFSLVCGPAVAQQAEMADTMRSNGKIYVLVGIMLILLTGLVIYLFLLDRKVSRLEKRFDDNR